MKEKLTIQPLKKREIKIAQKLTANLVGEGLYSKPAIKKAVKSKNHHFQTIKLNGEIIGYHYCIITKASEVPNVLASIAHSKIFAKMPKTSKIALFCSVGIKESYRKRGLVDFAITQAIATAKNKNSDIAVAYAWQKGENTPAKAHLIRHGFEEYEEIPKAWLNVETLKCPVCGKEKCECTAKIFIKRLNENA